MSQRQRPSAVHWMMVLLLTLVTVFGSWSGPLAAQTAPSPSAAFDQLYAATDGAQSGGLPALWGERLLERSEPYREGVEGQRLVRYYAKGRMELNQAAAGAEGVSYGRLVVELVRGTLGIGESASKQYAGADLPVAGDRDLTSNPNVPTYRSFRTLTSRNLSSVGQPVDRVLNAPERAGLLKSVVSAKIDPALGQLATNAVYIDSVGHNIPDVFWTVLRAQGAVGGHQLTWTSLYGWPLTDAYWVRARQAGRPVDVLVQLFERRSLLYIPSAPAGQRVQVGDVGHDYLRWREGLSNPALELSPPVSVNGIVVPPIGEAGTLFTIVGMGFKEGERIDAWAELGGVVSAIGVSERYRVPESGMVGFRLRTVQLLSGAGAARVVIRGSESGHEAMLQFRWLATDLQTPGAEAAEPTNVPLGRNATISPAVLPVGSFGRLQAEGFAPNETVTAWVTTGLSRVLTYSAYLQAIRRPPESLLGPPSTPTPTPPAPRLRMQADAQGRLTIDLPGPGYAVPGVYAITMIGDTSESRAVAYFRARAGESWATYLLFGLSLSDLLDGRDAESPLISEPPVFEIIEASETIDLQALQGVPETPAALQAHGRR